MKSLLLFAASFVAIFVVWVLVAGVLLARDADLTLALRQQGEHLQAPVIARSESVTSKGTPNERTTYGLRLRIQGNAGALAEVQITVDKARYDAQPEGSTVAVVAMANEPSRFMLEEDFARHGTDGVRSDAEAIRFGGGALVATLVSGIFVALRRRSPPPV